MVIGGQRSVSSQQAKGQHNAVTDLMKSWSRPQAVQLEFGDVKGWDVYLAATTEKALPGSNAARLMIFYKLLWSKTAHAVCGL